MKTMTFFEVGYLDLIKMLFFGKKIRLVPSHDAGCVAGTATRATPAPEWPVSPDAFEDPGQSWNWNPGSPFNPYTGNPFDTPSQRYWEGVNSHDRSTPCDGN